MKYSVIIKCSLSDYNYVIKKLFQGNIEVINSYYNDKDYFFILYENDYKELLKIDYRKSTKFVRYNGILNIINFIKHYALYFFITISISIILFLSNYIIIFVRIHTSDINLKRVIRYYLMDNNIRSFSLMKDYKEIEKIK